MSVQADEYRVSIEAETQLVELMAELCQLPAEEQHEALVYWARSPVWAAPLMLLTGWQGKVARAAYAALQRDLAADTPGRRWELSDWKLGRASIYRLLGLEDDPHRTYAAIPFRTWLDDDGRSWIAGAIGVRPLVEKKDAEQRWEHLDIRDVILWDPRTNEATIAGEHHTHTGFVMPDIPDQRLKVWGDPGSFFRAWAGSRVRTAKQLQAQARGDWRHPVSEASDSGLPGALLIGNVMRARWPGSVASAVVAGPGLTAAELHMAAIRSANLPNFEGGTRGRGD